MKLLILIGLLLAIFSNSFSQSCDSLNLKFTTDKYTKKTSINLKYPIVKKAKNNDIEFMMNLSRQKDDTTESLFFQINSKDFSCIDQYDKIYILFTDGESEIYMNHASYNCKGFAMTFINSFYNNRELQTSLSNKLIESIEVRGSSSYEMIVSKAAAEKFQKSAKCFFKK